MMTEWYPAHIKPAPVQGWRLVPIEPTNEMMRAFFEAAGKWVNEEGADEDVYIAMLDAAPNSHECTRSHPHENMDAMCELRTEIARLTNENARLKAQPSQQSCYCPECERLSKELAELRAQPQQEPVAWGVDWGKAGDISCVSIIKRLPDGRIEVVAVEYAPYSHTSPPAQRTWVGLTDERIVAGARLLNQRMAEQCGVDADDQWALYADDFKADARAVLEAAHGIYAPSELKEDT